MELDSLYGSLFAGPANRPPSSSPEAEDLTEDRQGGGDDNNMFSGPPPGSKAALAAAAAAEKKEEGPASGPLPQSNVAAKLMMPPVRKKAEPGKKPMLPSLDIAKLQEEKAALMRQREAAAAKPAFATASNSSFSPSVGAGASPSSGAGASAGAGSTALTASLYGSPDEEYDPAKPNDYDEFCRRRMRLKAEEELEKRRQDALARHAKGQAPVEPKEDDFATKMLKKMGWKEGSGLGKDGQGMSTPLILKKTDTKQGSVVEGGKRDAPVMQPPGQAAPKQAKVVQRPPSCILLLNNLVGAGEVDEDLEEETAEEASKYGKVKKCAIKEMKGLPDDEAVRIFLEFTCIEDATKALVDMNGRYFGGRVVKARFFDPERFNTGDLDKKTDE